MADYLQKILGGAKSSAASVASDVDVGMLLLRAAWNWRPFGPLLLRMSSMPPIVN